MAFDQSTRNRLQKFVSEARSILTEEFTRQLQASYGMDPKNGTIAELDTLNFLDNQGRQTATILRETLAHYVMGISGKSEKERTKQALDRIIREQAFTVLNRLGALRMAEARGFLLESIAKGYSSKGFQLYKNLAGTALGETGDAYRQYLFSLFDEFSLDLAVLFDRHSSQGRLFPRESALLALLDQINHFEIEHLWSEDETIGWIYQYFNSQEERKKMRAESQAPRNSRELAVRNQFFTPRYVVEFLTDNTLGRIWYEMTQGKTALAENCRYLVRRPNEIFLAKGESAPESESEDQESLSQEELLKQPVYIPFRELKDPRELRMLDPACGSMHFGLYAFDLFEKIYEEAWQLETELGAGSFSRSKGLEPLQATYSSFDEFRKAIPKLIIECNIHGVDIDPRAVQIAGLSLWQRAQRAWHLMGIKPHQRPTIKKSNIVCAEPMPGEKEMLREFTGNLNPPVLGQLVETIFDKMELAGEAGTLLKIEEEIASTISKAKDEFNKELLRRKEEQGYIPGFAPKREATLFDFAELTDETSFWDTAEERILEALSAYADQAESGDGQKRLFAEDAAKGFAFIDLCRKRFDVVLMNPPFGKQSKRFEATSKKAYPDTWKEIYSSFFERAKQISLRNGYLGGITSSQFLYTKQMIGLRELWLQDDSLDIFIQLGHGVLDDAMVETGLSVATKNPKDDYVTYADLRNIDEKPESLQNGSYKYLKISSFKILDNHPFSFDTDPEILQIWGKRNTFKNKTGTVATGNHTFDDFRFVRLFWEVSPSDIGENWKRFDKGGEYQPYISPTKLVLDWSKDGSSLRALNQEKYGSDAQVMQASKYWNKPGICYSHVSSVAFGPRILNKDTIFSSESIAVFTKRPCCHAALLAFLNSSICQDLIWVFGRYRKIENRAVSGLPIDNDLMKEIESSLSNEGNEAISMMLSLESFDETSPYFISPVEHQVLLNEGVSIKKICAGLKKVADSVDEKSIQLLGIDISRLQTELAAPRSSLVEKYACRFLKNKKAERMASISFIFGIVLGRWEEKCDSTIEIDPILALPRTQPSSKNANDCLIVLEINESFNYQFESVLHNTLNDENLTVDTLELFKIKTISDLFINNNFFFDFHLKQHSASRRQAPIYWPLQTPSGSYTLWVYYHRLTEQTLYTCVNDFVEPKLKTVTDDLNGLRNKSARSSAEEKELAKLSDLETELKDFRDELLRLAKFWKPNLNDGVQITAAPLWKLFQHKPWQKKLKETWDKLEKGDFDWAHLAYSIWPERVLRKCHEDRSLAIAHDVEDDFWEEIEVPVIRRGKDTGETKFEWQPKKLSETQLRELIRQKMAEAK